MHLTIKQRSHWEQVFNIRNLSSYIADIRLEKQVTFSNPMVWKDGRQVVETTKEISYEIIYQGERRGSISKGWARTGGWGWCNSYVATPNMARLSGSYKNLEAAVKGAADHIRSADLATAMQTAGVK